MPHNNSLKKASRNRTDQEKLELFVNKTNKLKETQLVLNGFSINYSIHYEIGKPLESKLDQPVEADLREHLLIFRPFISEKEDIFLEHILNICSKRLTSDESKENVALIRKVYKEIKSNSATQLYWNTKRYTPIEITDIYLNGEYFHNDLESQEILDNVPPPLKGFLRIHFLNFLIETSKLIVVVSNNIEYSLKENSFNF